MAIKFFNIRTGETRVAETEPMISAYWASSDRSPNVQQGQDFGWRLAPETVVEVQRIQKDLQTIERIALTYKIPPEGVTETDILRWVSDKNDKTTGGTENTTEDFKRQYEEEIRSLQQRVDSARAKKASENGQKVAVEGTSAPEADEPAGEETRLVEEGRRAIDEGPELETEEEDKNEAV